MKLNTYRIHRLAIVLASTLGLLTLLLIFVSAYLPEGLFEDVVHTIGYKLLLILPIWLVFAFLLSIFYYRSVINIIIHDNYEQKSKPSHKEEPTEDESLKTYKTLLETLASDEKELLKKYIHGDKSILYFNDSEDGLAESLRKKQILYQATNIAQAPHYKFGYSIEPIVKKCLSLHPELLD